MPVIQLSLNSLGQYCKGKADQKTILDTLPYLGLDIEDHEGDTVSVEYSPNRPDYSSEAGIARSLTGLLGIAVGAPKYRFSRSKFVINVSDTVKKVRPIIKAIYAEYSLNDERIKRLIAMQEDLHNGIGRKRAKVAIGIHNADVISKKIEYHSTRESSFSFVPLGYSLKQTIEEIITKTEQGIAYGKLLRGTYPILEDSNGNVLSMPPVINGDLTRLGPGQSKLFIDLTGTDERIVDISTAIFAAMLSDSGGRVYSVDVKSSQGYNVTPNMTPNTMRFDLELANAVLGYEFSMRQAKAFLAKSRIGMYSNRKAKIPRYRFDILHPIDLVEEVALGFGIQSIKPQNLKSSLVGSLDYRQRKLDGYVEAFVGLGLIEVWNISLTGSNEFSHNILRVEDSKSERYEYLRPELLPSLLSVLGSSTHEEYPQKIFEQAPVFRASSEVTTGVSEEEHAAVLIAESGTNYSAIRSILDAFLKLTLSDGTRTNFRASTSDIGSFAGGRSALVSISGERIGDVKIGVVGELHPAVLERFGVAIPVAGFEMNLEPLVKQ